MPTRFYLSCWTVVLILIGTSPTSVAAEENRWVQGVERATRATVGILQPSLAAPSQASKAHFSVRGSGIHIGEGFIVTVRHAVKLEQAGKTVIPKEIMVLTTDLMELPAVLKGVNPFLDIALYKVLVKDGLPPLAVSPFEDKVPEPGDEVFTVGYPLGWGPAVGFGRIGNLNTFLPTVQSRLVQVDLSACSGNSGGGIFNAEGKILGVVHAIIQTGTVQEDRRCSRFTFAVPGNLVRRIAAALIEGKNPGFSKLGLRMTAVKDGTRWLVAASDVMGPARIAGIQKGDILLAIEHTPITSAAQLKSYLIEHTEPGQQVTIRVRRGPKEHLLTIILGRS